MSVLSESADIIPPSLLLRAYEIGIFPMADGDDDEKIVWIEPKKRGVITLDSAHIPKRVWRYIRKNQPKVVFDHPHHNIIDACASKTQSRKKTWINKTIRQTYHELFLQGVCHTISVCDHDNNLLGGLYGIVIGSVFFGESMVSFAPRASQIALAALFLRMAKTNFKLLDCQFTTPHLQHFGCYELNHKDYLELLQPHIHRAEQRQLLDHYCENELLQAAQNPMSTYPFEVPIKSEVAHNELTHKATYEPTRKQNQ